MYPSSHALLHRGLPLWPEQHVDPCRTRSPTYPFCGVVGMVTFPTFALLLLLPRSVAEIAEPQAVASASLLELDRRKIAHVRRETQVVQEAQQSQSEHSTHDMMPRGILADSPMVLELRGEPKTGSYVAVEQSWRAVYSLVVMILIAISPIGLKEGLRPFCTVVIYLACLSLVKMWVKETMNAGFQYPDSITAVHMFCTSLAACCFERPRLEEALLVLPISVVNGASLLTNNTALLYGGVAFVSMVSSCTPMFTFGLELFKKRRSLDFLTSFSVILVCSGSAFCVRGEKTASVLALVFASMAALLRAMKGVWQHDLLTISVSPMRLVYWSGFWSFWITISMVALNEGTEAVRHFPTAKPEAKSAFLLSVCAAVVLNITQCFAVKQLGALLQSIVGNLNLILVIALSQAWLREQVTFWQYVGVFLLAAGTFANKYGGLQKKNTEKEQLVEKKTDAQEQAGERTPEPEPSETSETSYGATDSTGAEAERSGSCGSSG
ncbi:unnamed protein product [Durusdinium trenchii]|uniref:Sugar phosphate transporter domain-containing protein n=3 Tax=Durusdinium trenchii TaxID=1381693 RepID=A0ABP0JK63_9DINO